MDGPYDPAELWRFLPFGYVLTVLLESPVLWIGLSPPHSWRRKLFAGGWLTACTYPIVVLVLPMLLERFGRPTYLAVAETFAPLGECLLFWLAFGSQEPRLARRDVVRDCVAIVLANLTSFGVGMWIVG